MKEVGALALISASTTVLPVTAILTAIFTVILAAIHAARYLRISNRISLPLDKTSVTPTGRHPRIAPCRGLTLSDGVNPGEVITSMSSG